MPTKPFEDLLYRELSKVSAKESIDIACPMLRELVNFSTNALVRCATSTSEEVDRDLAVMVIYRHIIEMTDGTEVLISECCPDATVPLLRSIFEALLSLEFILETEEDYADRSLSWLVCAIHARLNLYDRLDSTTNKGMEHQKAMSQDKAARGMRMLAPHVVEKPRADLSKMLGKPHLVPIDAEYRQWKSQRGPLNWFTLFGGPKNRRSLAVHLKRGGQYDILYRQWSAVAHGEDPYTLIDLTDDGEPTIRNLRSSDSLCHLASLAVSLSLDSTVLMLKKFRSGENLWPWYDREVREPFLFLSHRQVNPAFLEYAKPKYLNSEEILSLRTGGG